MLIPASSMANILGGMLEQSTPQAQLQNAMVRGMVAPPLSNASADAQDRAATRAAKLKQDFDAGLIDKEFYDEMITLTLRDAKVPSEILQQLKG